MWAAKMLFSSGQNRLLIFGCEGVLRGTFPCTVEQVCDVGGNLLVDGPLNVPPPPPTCTHILSPPNVTPAWDLKFYLPLTIQNL